MAQRRANLWWSVSGLALFAYVAAEVAALIWVASSIGWWTLAILLVSSVIGVFLLQREWRKAWGSLSESLRSGQLPSGQMADATLILLGGVLLVLPGLLSDLAGVLLLLPFTRPFVRSAISWWAARTMQRSGMTPVVIEGEATEEPEQGDTLIPGIAAPTAEPDGEIVEGTLIEPDDPRA